MVTLASPLSLLHTSVFIQVESKNEPRMKYLFLLVAIILMTASCKQGSNDESGVVQIEVNDKCTGDTIISGDSLISFFHVSAKDVKGKTRIMYQKCISNDKASGELVELKGDSVTQVIPFYTNLGMALPYYLVNCYKHEGNFYISELRAYDMHVPCPVGIFPDHESSISSKPYNHDKWELRQGRHTSKCLILINEEEETLYLPQIGADSIPTDRYIAYQFNGSLMTKSSNNAPNPYLHKSLADYRRLRRQNDTFATLERVDELNNGQLRFALWAKGRKGRKVRTISEEPDLVIYGGTEYAPNCYTFESNGSKFNINLERPIEK